MADVEKVKALLAENLLEQELSRFRDGDYHRLASNGYCDLAAFTTATREDLKDALPGRVALVRALLRAFTPENLQGPRQMGTLTEADVYGVCERVWSVIEEKMHLMPKEQDFKRSYLRSKKPVCTIGKRPVLLLQGLAEGAFFKSSAEVLDQFEETGSQLCFLVDASGSGKTRTLYEICCRDHSIYLTGVSDTGLVDEGSSDLSYLASKLEKLYPGKEIPDDALDVCLSALFISRLYILSRVQNFCDPLCWLFKQVYFKELRYPYPDPWKQFTYEILSLIDQSSQIERFQPVFMRVISKLKTEVDWKGVVVVDECQELSETLNNRFRSRTTTLLNRGMLDKLFLSIQSIGFGSRVICSGTGRHLLRVQDSLSEFVKDRLSYFKYTSFGDFSSVEAMEEYSLTVLDNGHGFDFSKIFLLYKGRCRLLVTVLQMFLCKSDKIPGLDGTEFFLQKADQLCLLPGKELKINRSVCSLCPLSTTNVSTLLLLLRVFTGVEPSLVITDGELRLVQAGIGRITTKAKKPLHFKSDVISNSPGNSHPHGGDCRTYGRQNVMEFPHSKRPAAEKAC